MLQEQYTGTVRQGQWGNLGWLKRKLKKPLKGPGGTYTIRFRLYTFKRKEN
jgi:hypothetical protein